MNGKLIRLHKESNLMQIKLKKESIANVYYNLIDKYNNQHEYKPLEISKSDLWEMAGLKGNYNSRDLRELIEELTKSNSYTITENHKIAGSMFVVEYLGDKIKIYVPEPFRKLIFYKKDIDLMYKAKHKKVLSIAELDHYDNVTKEKSKFLVLLKKADILGIKGKYNKRLYSLLMQFKKTGIYFTTWDNFKELLEVSKSYRAGEIDRSVLNPAKKELLKVGIDITQINKIKKGRSIDRIEISFKVNEKTRLKENQEIENKKEEFVGIEKEMIYTEKQIENAMLRCSQGENIPIEFLENLKKMSEKLFMKTIMGYVEEV